MKLDQLIPIDGMWYRVTEIHPDHIVLKEYGQTSKALKKFSRATKKLLDKKKG